MNTLITHFLLRNAVPLFLVKGAAFRKGWAMMLLVSLPADSDDRLLGAKIDNIRDIGEMILQNRQIIHTVSAATTATLPPECTCIPIDAPP